MVKTRIPRDGPFCWQSKAARRAIRDAFDATNNVCTALSVYDALSEIASDTGSETFTAAHAWIARLSGVSVRTIQSHLKIFATLGLIQFEVPALRAPCTYRLLSFGNHCAASGDDCTTSGNQCAAFGNGAKRAALPRIEELERNSKKTSSAPAGPGRARDVLFDALAIAEGSDPGQLTKDGARRVAVALAQIKAVCPELTISEIQRRARIYRSVMPSGSRLTANALAVNWAKCGGELPVMRFAPDLPAPPEGWRTMLEQAYPGNAVNREGKPWAEVPDNIRAEVFPTLQEASA